MPNEGTREVSEAFTGNVKNDKTHRTLKTHQGKGLINSHALIKIWMPREYFLVFRAVNIV